MRVIDAMGARFGFDEIGQDFELVGSLDLRMRCENLFGQRRAGTRHADDENDFLAEVRRRCRGQVRLARRGDGGDPSAKTTARPTAAGGVSRHWRWSRSRTPRHSGSGAPAPASAQSSHGRDRLRAGPPRMQARERCGFLIRKRNGLDADETGERGKVVRLRRDHMAIFGDRFGGCGPARAASVRRPRVRADALDRAPARASNASCASCT